MPAVEALEHVFSSVERGLFPGQGRGFQTVAASEGLIGSADLGVLEEAAFYALSRERRGRRDSPDKETFFRLPSGRFAVGRTVYRGVDALGREGNYLTRHLVVDREALLELDANPFALLDAPELSRASPEVVPRRLPTLALDLPAAPPEARDADGTAPDLLAGLIAAIVDGGEKTVLLIGDEQASRRAVRALFSLLAQEERLRLTFSSHFYESHHLRPRYALAAVGAGSEAPAQRQDYLAFDLAAGLALPARVQSAYARWLAGRVEARDWAPVAELNRLLDRLRGERRGAHGGSLPETPEACAALWERAGARAVPELLGRAQLLKTCLERPLATALLAAAAPSALCGPEASPETIAGLLGEIKAVVAAGDWQDWVGRWRGDPALDLAGRQERPWWRKWGR